MCYTYDKSKGGDTRELQSRMVPPKKKLGRVTLSSPTFNYLYRTFSFFLLYFVSVSGDGTLSVFNVRRQKIEERSDNMESELLSLAIVKVNMHGN